MAEDRDKNNYLCSDNDGNDIVSGFHVNKIRIRPYANVIGAPVETGQMVFDNKVIMPKEIVVEGVIVLPDKESGKAISTINDMLANRKFKFYSVKTDAGVHKNLILKECPSTEDRDQPDFLMYELTFVEALLIQNTKYTPANPNNTDTKNSGNQQGNRTNAGRGNMIIMR